MDVCRPLRAQQGELMRGFLCSKFTDGIYSSSQDYLYELWAHVKKLAPESHDSHLHALVVCLLECFPFSNNNTDSREDTVQTIGYRERDGEELGVIHNDRCTLIVWG